MIDPRFSSIVKTFSWAAAIIGLLFGWFPGSDVVILLILWIAGIACIVSASGRGRLSEHWFELVLTTIGAGFLFAAGIGIAQALTLPIFFIVNPVLNYLATYRMLRAAAGLYAQKDSEEVLSNVFTSIWTLISSILFDWS